ncbi:MAG TPA: MBL fold metallo-hydrolase [Thermodesulfobacteriota bacterium]
MRLLDGVYLVGSGTIGLSAPTDCNVYVVDAGESLVMVDAGSGMAPADILDNLRADGLDPARLSHIVLTHSHWDHVRGCRALAAGGAAVLVHEAGRAVVEEGPYARRDVSVEPVRVSRTLTGGERLAIGRVDLEVVALPGHSLDSIAVRLVADGRSVCFTGDTALAMGICGPTAPEDMGTLKSSVARLDALGIDALLPGHGLFVLRGGRDHVALLDRKLRERWYDAYVHPSPFSPAWHLARGAAPG